MNTEKILLDLIKCVIVPQSNVMIDSSLLTTNRQKELFVLSKRHDLAHLIGYQLNKMDALVEDILIEKFNEEQFMAVFRYERINHEYQNIRSLFNDNNISYIPLKGSVIRNLYPESWMRTSCDIDVLVKEEDVQRSANLLVDKFNYKKGKLDYHDISLISPSDIHLELHYSLCENIESIDKLLVKVWDYSFKVQDSNEFRMSNEYFIFHIIAHMMYHFVGGGCGVRTLIDLYLIRKNLNYDEQKLFEMLENCGVKKFYVEMVNLIQVWFENGTHSELSLELEKFILSGGVYGVAENKFAIMKTKGNKKSYLMSRIFVPYNVLKNKYPVLKKHKWLTPLYQLKRWFSLLFAGKFKKAKKEIKSFGSVPNEKVISITKMFNELGLNLDEKEN